MLEVKYKEEKNPSEKSTDEAPEKNAEEFELPKNVKQVGEVEKERKLYIEDYVITYLQQLTKNDWLLCTFPQWLWKLHLYQWFLTYIFPPKFPFMISFFIPVCKSASTKNSPAKPGCFDACLAVSENQPYIKIDYSFSILFSSGSSSRCSSSIPSPSDFFPSSLTLAMLATRISES